VKSKSLCSIKFVLLAKRIPLSGNDKKSDLSEALVQIEEEWKPSSKVTLSC
jgi:hypothetical protein